MNARLCYPIAPRAGVSLDPAPGTGACPPHITSTAWWLAYSALLCAALLFLN